jgi:hypothetical protein
LDNLGRQLVLHIGGHKTGTTSIQRALYTNRTILEELGYKLFVRSKGGEDSGNGLSGGWFSRNDAICDGLRFDMQLADELGSARGNIILSQENFSWIFSREAIESFHDQLKKHFERILIVAYIRRQDELAISHHQQGSRSLGYFSSVFYGSENKALPSYQEHFQNYLNFHQRIGMWADIFGDKQISLHVFDKKTLFAQDVVSDFFRLLGSAGTIRFDRVNESNGFIKSKVGHLLNLIDMEEDKRAILFRRLNNAGKLVPARQEAIDFYAHFKNSNYLLNQRFKLTSEKFLFDDDFDHYPEAPGDQWTEDSANDAILGLLQGVKSMPIVAQGGEDLLCQCVSELRKIDIKSASELQLLLGKYYPGHGKHDWKQKIKGLIGRLRRRLVAPPEIN